MDLPHFKHNSRRLQKLFSTLQTNFKAQRHLQAFSMTFDANYKHTVKGDLGHPKPHLQDNLGRIGILQALAHTSKHYQHASTKFQANFQTTPRRLQAHGKHTSKAASSILQEQFKHTSSTLLTTPNAQRMHTSSTHEDQPKVPRGSMSKTLSSSFDNKCMQNW